MEPAKHEYAILKQICNLIPAHLVPKLARTFGADKKAHSFSPWSHIVAMLHVQIAHKQILPDNEFSYIIPYLIGVTNVRKVCPTVCILTKIQISYLLNAYHPACE